MVLASCSSLSCNFYPRSPRGERRFPAPPLSPDLQISIHAPRVGSDIQNGNLELDASVQFLSTLPAWGATYSIIVLPIPAVNFYPRSPRGERRGGSEQGHTNPAISIHAPRVGSDRVNVAHRILFRIISIHAPRVGSDEQRKGSVSA